MKTGVVECGLRYAVKRSGSQVACCSLSIRCGARSQGDFHSGIAHFCEHALFKGTGKKSATVINNYLDRLGGELNAYTTKEEIVLHATVLKEDWVKAADLLLELANDPTFPAKEVEKEKGVIIEEINSYKDSPSDDVYDRFEEMLFEGHPLGNSILGTVASVRKINSAELSNFVKTCFLPQKMAFAVVADVDEAEMENKAVRLLNKYYALRQDN